MIGEKMCSILNDFKSYQVIRNTVDHIDSKETVGNVLPLTFDNGAGFNVTPRKEVVVAAIEYSIGWRSGRRTHWYTFIKIVTIVTNADFKFNWCIVNTDHICLEKGSV